MTAPHDYSGQRFGRWTMVSYVGKGRWLCRCDCGTESIHRTYAVTGGGSKGCMKCRPKPTSAFRHGQRRTPLYAVWAAMINRCESENDRAYKNYGGRGIKICDEWRADFVAFRNWATGSGYKQSLTMDREDNNGDYTPENCRWVSAQEQAWNKRTNKIVAYRGEKAPLSKLARHHGLHPDVVNKRVYKLGWSVERALNSALHKKVGQRVVAKALAQEG